VLYAAMTISFATREMFLCRRSPARRGASATPKTTRARLRLWNPARTAFLVCQHNTLYELVYSHPVRTSQQKIRKKSKNCNFVLGEKGGKGPGPFSALETLAGRILAAKGAGRPKMGKRH
jgi:hypothetical protein